MEWLNLFLNNRLACLVRDLLEIPYIKAVFASFGVHIIEPFHCRTIQKGATHTQFDGVAQDLFNGVKKSYGEEVLEAVKNIAKKCEKE